MSVAYFKQGIFLQKTVLTNKSSPNIPLNLVQDNQAENSESPYKQTKVIMMLVDALREDFVEYDKNITHYLSEEKSVFKGRKIQLFNDLSIEQPDNTILIPLASEMPTVTSVRVKGMMSGSLSAFFEIAENYGSDLVVEDNIFYQLKQKRLENGQPPVIVFAGDYIWIEMYGNHFDRAYPYPSFNVRDLDTLDNHTQHDLIAEIKDGNFTLLVSHILGIDHAGHTYSADHSEIERKLNDTEKIIGDVIESMDNDTVLLVFGDHGMTDDGNHGGGTQNELRSILFSYHKSGFPIKKKNLSIPENINSNLKQIDLASNVAMLLGLPIPFSNLGVLHPYFYLGQNITQLYEKYLNNIDQLGLYMSTYCQVAELEWCKTNSQESMINSQQFLIKNRNNMTEQDYIDACVEMFWYINIKFKIFQDIWTQYDDQSIIVGISIAIMFLLFQLIPTNSTRVKANSIAIIIFKLILFGYLALSQHYSIFLGILTSIALCLEGAVKITKVFIMRIKLAIIEIEARADFKIAVFILIIYIISQFAESLQTEGDYVIDTYVILILVVIYVSQQQETRSWNLIGHLAIIVACVKLSYYYDRERSLNFLIDPVQLGMKEYIQNMKIFSTYLPLVLYGVLQHFIIKSINIPDSKIQIVIGNIQIGLLFAVWFLNEENQFRHLLAKSIYISTIGLLVYTLCEKQINNVQKTTLLALVMYKPIFLLAGAPSQMLYFLLLIHFVVFKRLISNILQYKPSSFLLAFFYYFSMFQYFYRSGHRERINSLQMGKAFLGFPEFNLYVHGGLVILNAHGMFLLGLLLLPYVFSDFKNDDKKSKKKDEAVLKHHNITRPHTNIILKQLLFISSCLFVCSSIFAFVTRRELIFPQRTAHKYIFDMFLSLHILIMSSIMMFAFQ